MWTFASVLVICATLVWFFERWERKYRQVQQIKQHVQAMATPAPVSAPEPELPEDPIPADLLNLALSESEPWAKEQALGAMMDMRRSVGNWNVVRAVWTGGETTDQVS